MYLLFDFSVIHSGLWLNPVCKALSLLREPGATRARRQAGENPQARSWLPCAPSARQRWLPLLGGELLQGRVVGLGMDPGAPGQVPAGPLAGWGTDPPRGAEPIPTRDISPASLLGWGEARWSLSS